MELQPEQLTNLLKQQFSERPSAKQLTYIAQKVGMDESHLRTMADDIWPRDAAAPYLLIDLGCETLRPGLHLSPECELLFSGWDGQVTVRTWIDGLLNNDGWQESPRVCKESTGFWTFHQSLSLMRNDQFCLPGTYRIHFECHFHSPLGAGLFESCWKGHFRMTVPVDQGQPRLEIESEGHGLVNLNGVNLREFTAVSIKAGNQSLVNIQEFLSALKAEAPADGGQPKSSQIIPVPLSQERFDNELPQRPVAAARIDFSNNKHRIVLFARNELILGRNRPGTSDSKPTDVALRLLPLSPANNQISATISQQHLVVAVEDGCVQLCDPRDSRQRMGKPAFFNSNPLPTSPVELPCGRPHRYKCSLGEEQAIGLDITTFRDDDWLDHFHQIIQRIPGSHQSPILWKRETAGIDALRIDRVANTDDFNGRESYLMVLGLVLIGSSKDCPIQISGSGVRPEHAALIHWDGQFRLIPIGNAPVTLNDCQLPPGLFTQLRLDVEQRISFGDAEVQFAPRAQLEIDADA